MINEDDDEIEVIYCNKYCITSCFSHIFNVQRNIRNSLFGAHYFNRGSLTPIKLLILVVHRVKKESVIPPKQIISSSHFLQGMPFSKPHATQISVGIQHINLHVHCVSKIIPTFLALTLPCVVQF